jgi:hypothetical protein
MEERMSITAAPVDWWQDRTVEECEADPMYALMCARALTIDEGPATLRILAAIDAGTY